MEKVTAYKQSRSDLDHFQRQIDNDDSVVRQLFGSNVLVRAWFWWRMIIFLVDLYYISECYLWLAFPEFYQTSITTLLPMNIIFLVLLCLNLIFKFILTPKVPVAITQEMGWLRTILLNLQHYLSYDWNGLSAFITVLFLVSFLVPYQVAKYIHLVYVLRLVEMQSLMKNIYKKIHIYKVLRVFYHIGMLFFFIFYLSHFFACIFYYIDQTLIQEQYFGDPSLNPNNYYQLSSQSFTPIEMLTSSQRYIMALYFANGLVTTIAFGDIVGRNFIEDAYVLILQVISTVIIAFLLEQFLIMLQDNSFAIFQIVKKFRSLRMLMRVKNVSKKLQIKIRNYLFYLEYYNKFSNPSQIVDKLSYKMQLDIYFEAYGESMKELFYPLGFRNIRVLCKSLEEITYQPERDIFFPEPKIKAELISKDHMIDASILRPSLIYLVKGKMFQYLRWEEGGKQFEVRRKKKFFNVFQFFTSRHVRFGLRSKTMARALTLSADKLQQLLNEDESLHKQMRELKEQMLCNSRSRQRFQDDCQVCEGRDHSVLDCPQVHHVVDETIVSAWKMREVLLNFVNVRRTKVRSEIKSRKQMNVLHFSVVLGKLNFAELFEREVNRVEAEEDLGASLLLRMINLLSDGQARGEEEGEITVYDENGVREFWSLEQNIS